MLFERKDCLSPIKKEGKTVIKELSGQGALYSFCIPTYKRRKELKEALDSIFSQVTDIPFNVVLSDNNPERGDETEELISQYYADRDNLYYLKNETNLGMAGNWNRLILECETPYMILFHDDDVLFPNFLSRVDEIRRQNPDMSAFNSGKVICRDPSLGGIRYKKGRICFHTAQTNYCRFLFGAPSGCLFKVSDLISIGGFDEESYPSIDYVAIEKLCLENKIVLSTTEPLMFYRTGENATARLETQIKWLDVDYQIKTELKEKLAISSLLYKITLWFEIRMRLRSINKQVSNYNYKGFSAGGRFFCLLYLLYARFLTIKWCL